MPLETKDNALKELLPISMTYLPDYFNEKARREFNETSERKLSGLEELKEMARDHKLTCDIDFVDDFLLQFLRQRKYDVSRAFKQLVRFVSFRKSHSSFFLSVNNDIFDVLYKDPRQQFGSIFPLRCPEGCTILLLELGKWDPEKVTVEELWQMGVMLFNQSLRDPMTQINGFKLIYDFKDTGLKHARHCTPSNLYLLYHGIMECFPGRYKAIHLVSESLMLRSVWTMGKGLLSQKLKQRIFISTSREDLLNHFPSSVLPPEYGGQMENSCNMEWMKRANKEHKRFALQGQRNYY